ncbi:hypothetical protein ACKF11_01970 [Methylobacillus sp. Pita2]|uniref:hypothetical protein n=1 Tax=Methylobacillus sp. Pita2 TaxID=3383245 RepID=UPI0038B5B591
MLIDNLPLHYAMTLKKRESPFLPVILLALGLELASIFVCVVGSGLRGIADALTLPTKRLAVPAALVLSDSLNLLSLSRFLFGFIYCVGMGKHCHRQQSKCK